MIVVVLFLIQNKTVFENKAENETSGLVYDTKPLGSLVDKSTAGDGIPDWEKILLDVDPTQKQITPGMSNSAAIQKLISDQQAKNSGTADGSSTTGDGSSTSDNSSLTETDKFSRELVGTVATLNQNGSFDQSTIDQIGGSLADRIQNTTPRKVYTVSDLKIAKTDDAAAVQSYSEAIITIEAKYRAKETVPDVLQKLLASDGTIDPTAMPELDPIISQMTLMVHALAQVSVPRSLAVLHLSFLNSLERLLENTTDIKQYDSDSIVALSAISQYNQNSQTLQTDIKNLENAIEKKLNS